MHEPGNRTGILWLGITLAGRHARTWNFDLCPLGFLGPGHMPPGFSNRKGSSELSWRVQASNSRGLAVIVPRCESSGSETHGLKPSLSLIKDQLPEASPSPNRPRSKTGQRRKFGKIANFSGIFAAPHGTPAHSNFRGIAKPSRRVILNSGG